MSGFFSLCSCCFKSQQATNPPQTNQIQRRNSSIRQKILEKVWSSSPKDPRKSLTDLFKESAALGALKEPCEDKSDLGTRSRSSKSSNGSELIRAIVIRRDSHSNSSGFEQTPLPTLEEIPKFDDSPKSKRRKTPSPHSSPSKDSWTSGWKNSSIDPLPKKRNTSLSSISLISLESNKKRSPQKPKRKISLSFSTSLTRDPDSGELRFMLSESLTLPRSSSCKLLPSRISKPKGVRRRSLSCNN